MIFNESTSKKLFLINSLDAVLVAAYAGLLYNHFARGMDGHLIFVAPVFYPFGKESTSFDYGGIKKVDNLFGQFQPPPPFSY